MTRRAGPAGDYDYETRGGRYAARRRADPRVAALMHAALGEASTVVNVGAGAGSYVAHSRLIAAVPMTAASSSR